MTAPTTGEREPMMFAQLLDAFEEAANQTGCDQYDYERDGITRSEWERSCQKESAARDAIVAHVDALRADLARVTQIETAARAFLVMQSFGVHPTCNMLHHTKRDRHDNTEECPVQARYYEAKRALESALTPAPEAGR